MKILSGGGDSPLVKARKLVLTLLVPLTASLEVVLVMQPTAYGAAPRKPLGDVLPLHTAPT